MECWIVASQSLDEHKRYTTASDTNGALRYRNGRGWCGATGKRGSMGTSGCGCGARAAYDKFLEFLSFCFLFFVTIKCSICANKRGSNITELISPIDNNRDNILKIVLK